MSEPNQTTPAIHPPPKHKSRRILKVAVIFLVAVATVLLAGILAMYAYNNLSFTDDETFSRDLDSAIEKSHNWVKLHKQEILDRRNIALIRMLQDINTMKPDPLCSSIVNSFMSEPVRPDCWKRLLDPNWPVISSSLNKAIEEEYIDNKWILYAIAPKKAQVTPAQIRLYDRSHWEERQLTHQLWALIHLRRTQGPDDKLDALIEHLCDRITKSQRSDIAVADLYIQKVAFVLKAGFPRKIRRRWVERIIANQRTNGGWNDKWLFFTSRRRPSFSLSQPVSNQHATVQALWLLYQVKYRHGIVFHTAE